MKRVTLITTLVCAGTLAACGDETTNNTAAEMPPSKVDAPSVTFNPATGTEGTVSKPGAPFTLKYKVLGTPLVGVQVPIELRVESAFGSEPISISYDINDTSALSFPEAQPAKLKVTPAANQPYVEQMLTVIPQREGRLYVNVQASIETESGARTMVMAVPIQVGSGGRELTENGSVGVDEKGEAIRSLPAKED